MQILKCILIFVDTLYIYVVHPRLSGPRLTGSSINRPGSTGRYIQLCSLKSTRFTVEKLESNEKWMF